MKADRAAVLARSRLPAEAVARLDAVVAELERWTSAINLVSRASLAEVWSRHIADSAQLLPLAPAGARRWVDLGSGGGFPGLVIAILAASERPGLGVTLVESDRRKAAFLLTAARAAGVGVEVKAARAEDLPPLAADVVSARAVAPLPELLALVERHLAPGGVALLPKGSGHAAEVAAARRAWAFDLRTHPSATDPDAAILEIREVARA